MPPKKQSAPSLDAARYQGPGPSQAYRGRRAQAQSADPGALQKITALESELLKLRSQIAMIVTAAPSAGQRSQQPHSSLSASQERTDNFPTSCSNFAPVRSDGAAGFPGPARHVSCPRTGSHVHTSLCPSSASAPAPAAACAPTSSSFQLQRRDAVCNRADPATEEGERRRR